MDDETCKECYDCKSVFTTWRRKHHCRICGKSSSLLVEYATALKPHTYSGQIFCSRCASNVIKGSRFGHEGMIRVCNLCLEKLAKVDDDDDDDRRSIISTSTSPFAAHQMGHESLSLGLGSYSQSPFASSQLWGRQEEPLNLWSIAEAEARRQSGSDESGFGSRPITPNDLAREDGTWGFARKALAPFRRGFAEEEKDNATLTDTFNHDQSPTGPGAKTPVDFPVTVPVSTDGAKSSIQFPSSADNGPDSPGPNSLVRTRFNSYADFEASTPFIRSRVQSRLLDTALSTGEPGWRTRRESTAYVLRRVQDFRSSLHYQLRARTQFVVNVPPETDGTTNAHERRDPQRPGVGGIPAEVGSPHCQGADVHSTSPSSRDGYGRSSIREDQEDTRWLTERLRIRRRRCYYQERNTQEHVEVTMESQSHAGHLPSGVQSC